MELRNFDSSTEFTDGSLKRKTKQTPIFLFDSDEEDDHLSVKVTHNSPDLQNDLPSQKLVNILKRKSTKYRSSTNEEINNNISFNDTSLQKRRERSNSYSQAMHSVGFWKSLKYRCFTAWENLKINIASIFASLDFWKNTIQLIECHFGVGVASYFIFIRWLCLLNIMSFVLLFSFVVIPQFWYDARFNTTSLNVMEPDNWLTGLGWFQNSQLFYGSYISFHNITLIDDMPYEIPLAYILTTIIVLLLCLFVLLISNTVSLRKNYVESSKEFNSSKLLTELLCGWDYAIQNKKTAILRHKAMNYNLSELSFKLRPKSQISFELAFKTFLIRVGINILIISSVILSSFIIWVASVNVKFVNANWVNEMIVPLLITVIIYVFPFFFSHLAIFEEYQSGSVKFQVELARVTYLILSVLGVFSYHWFFKIDCQLNKCNDNDNNNNNNYYNNSSSSSTNCNCDNSTTSPLIKECWETWIAQDVYRLMLLDFFFSIGHVFFGEFFVNLFTKRCIQMPQPEFDIANNTLRLVYSQTLCWIGYYVSPLMSLIQIIKLVILFFVKRISVMHNCSPPKKAWRGARADMVFLLIMLLCFLSASASIIYSWADLAPSKHCGALRHYNYTVEILQIRIDWLRTAYPSLGSIWVHLTGRTSLLFVGAVLIVVLVRVHSNAVVVKDEIKNLRKNISMGGKDRAFLLRVLKRLEETNPERPQSSRRTIPNNTADSKIFLSDDVYDPSIEDTSEMF